MISQLFYLEFLMRWRQMHEWLYPCGFFVMLISLFPLIFSPDAFFLQHYFHGYVWLATLLSSLLAIETIFLKEWDDGSLEQFALSALPLPLWVIVKLTVHWLLTILPLILMTPLLCFLFHLTSTTTMVLCFSMLIGSPILILLNALAAALTLSIRQQGVLMGLIILPLVTPVIIFGVNLTTEASSGMSIEGAMAFFLAVSLLALIVLPLAIAATLRIGLDD